MSAVGSGDQPGTSLPPWAIRSGARQTIYFDPAQVCMHMRGGGGEFTYIWTPLRPSPRPSVLMSPFPWLWLSSLRDINWQAVPWRQPPQPPPSSQVTAAIITCGGLCPGLNDVVAGIVNKLDSYGVPEGKILGIKYGFK